MIPSVAGPRHSRAGRREIGPLVGLAALLLGLGFETSGNKPSTPARAPDLPAAGVNAGSNAQAEQILAQARRHLAEVEAAHGAGSLEAAEAIDGVVTLLSYGERASLLEARELSHRALGIRESILGPNHPDVARSLSLTVHVLWGLAEYAPALPLAERSLAIRTKSLGAEHRDVAGSLYQLAELRRATGDFAGAIRFHRRALAIWERTLGQENSEVASALHYLGVLYLTTGDRLRAKALLERALAIREKTLGPMHEQVATTLNALAEVSMQAGDRATARLLLERTQAIWEGALGPEHPHVARALTGRAQLLAEEGDTVGAKRLLERALEIRVKAFGPDHFLVARSLAAIANLMAVSGDDATAARFYLRALDVQRRTLGPIHPEVASTLAAQARLQWGMGEIKAALESALEAEAIGRESFRRSARDLTDDAALQYVALRTSGLDVAFTILAAGASGSEDGLIAGELPAVAIRRVEEELLRSRALVLDEMLREHRAPRLMEAGDSRREPAVGGPGLRDVLKALPDRSTLVSFVRYQRIDRQRRTSSAAYLALVLRPPTETPMAIPLGAAERIDALIAAWRAEISSDPRLPPRAGDDRIDDGAGTRLREAVWDPLGAALAGTRLVFVVPDGAINLVSLTALPAARGRYLVETGPLIHYLSAERDLVSHRFPGAGGEGVLVVGGPDFDAKPTVIAVADPGRSGRHGTGRPAPLCPEFEALRFEPLPGSRVEADEVAALWAGRGSVLQLTDARAGESEVRKSAPGRRILHLATHAYFLSPACASPLDMPELPDQFPIIGDRPLLRAGLAMAGANRRGEDADAAGDEDGILTAEEIASLDLSGVEWAVLSACDTGVGPIQAGEGVVGLRRAFEVAGAGTSIMSLWEVDDGAARLWMRKLYENRLSGLSTAEAVRRASVEIIEEQRTRGGTTHPYFWGGFVAAGDWR